MSLDPMLVASFQWNEKAQSFEALIFVLITFRNLVWVKLGSDVSGAEFVCFVLILYILNSLVVCF